MADAKDGTEDIFEQELTLLLLYLASWTEGKDLAPRAWKNHRFEIINALTAKGYLFDSKGRKSVNLTAEGVAVAKELAEKYRRPGPPAMPGGKSVLRESGRAAGSARKVYQFKITLEDAAPAIWRLVRVESDITLRQLSCIIQAAMGWAGGHLHLFLIGGAQYGIPDEDSEGLKDDSQTVLGRLPVNNLKKFIYEYDMGDGWRHKVELDAVMPAEPGKTYPLCLAGARACPPEDCGGIPGYEEFLEAIKDKKHPRHKELLDWIGGHYDPEHFDLEEANSALAHIDYDAAREELL